MLGKLITGGLVLLGGYKGWQWWERHKSMHAVTTGHSYALTFDYTKAPIAPATQQMIQDQLNTSHPGMFNVVGAAMVANAKQVAVTIVPLVDTYVTGDDLSTGWPAGFGAVTLDSIKDMGASSNALATATSAMAPTA